MDWAKRILIILFEGIAKLGEGIMNTAQKVLTVLKSAGGLSPAEAYAALSLGYSPTLYFNQDEESGTTVINSGSLASADGTYSASDIAGQTTGPFGGLAPVYNSADSDRAHVYSTALNGVFNPNDSTFDFWYRFDGTWSDASVAYISQFRFNTTNRILIYKNGVNTLRMFARFNNITASFDLDVSALGINDGAWHYGFVTFNTTGNSTEFYVDNVLRGSDVCDTWTTTGIDTVYAVIGASTSAGANPWLGSIKHYRWYQSLLDSTARTALYNGGPI